MIVEALYCQSLLKELGIDLVVRILSDSKVGRAMAQQQGVGRVKRFEIEDFFFQQLVSQNRVSIDKIRSEDNVADIVTKYLVGFHHKVLKEKLGFYLKRTRTAIV